MRGRPARELLRQSAPLIAVAIVLAVAPAAAAGTPHPDQAPSTPATLAPTRCQAPWCLAPPVGHPRG